MSNPPYIIDIQSPEQFEQLVIDASNKQPVLADFWAAWCQPCKVLIPLLTKLAEEYQGAFVLAKINSDEQKELAAANGVRSLPTVKLYKDGVVVNEFSGALPETSIREFLDKYIENETDLKINEAKHLSEKGRHDEALALLQQLNQEDPGNVKVRIATAQIHFEAGKLENCQEILTALPANIQVELEVKKIRTKLEAALLTRDAPGVDELLGQLQAEPDNHDARFQLAIHFIHKQNYPQALENLMEILSSDVNYKDGAAKQALLNVFEQLGVQDSLVRQYRSRLARLLY